MQLSFLTASMSASNSYQQMKPAMTLLWIILAVLFISSISFTLFSAQVKTRRRQRRTQKKILGFMYLTTLFVFVCTIACFIRFQYVGNKLMSDNTQKPSNNSSSVSTGDTNTDDSADTGDTSTSETEESIPDPTINPIRTEACDPDNWGINWEIITNGAIVDDYKMENTISFGNPDDYFPLPGVPTFRGNNYRNSAVYGTAEVTMQTLSAKWTSNVGSLNGWPGCGWTGQPLIVQWDEETKAIMNLYPAKKAKKDLVEVIYATLDGYIYFYDLDDGSYTRKPINVGMNFKGAGALDPRGYPIMYVGSGDYIGSKVPRMYIISLIDGSILYERSGNDAFSKREWTAFDSSPLVDAETDTLIWPGENGILYTIKLNTVYDKSAGTLEIAPEEIVKTRYTTERYLDSNKSSYWIGYEPSAVIVDRYLYISENGGMFFCIDLDTMELIWAQDTRDDSNSTPVFEWNDTLDGGYLYTAPSLHWTASGGKGYICIYKLDAETGEIVWEQKFNCYTVSGVSGGIQSSPLLGKPGTELEGLILYTIARTPYEWTGKLVALDTETGNVVWEKSMDNYAWSSPLAVYDKEGKAYIIMSDSNGIMSMLDSKGNTLTTLDLGSNVEASPAVFNNTLVVGTRAGLVYGIKIQ